jgi:hypothetical protein
MPSVFAGITPAELLKTECEGERLNPDSPHLDRFSSSLTPLRERLLAHPLYADLASVEALRTFMEYHVFAVWDFMSLLKALQQRLTSTSVPWLPPPPGQGAAARLINEIVLGEESDEDGRGGHVSHFEMYRGAMQDFGASTGPIDRFCRGLAAGRSVPQALVETEVPLPIARFVEHTFAEIESASLARIAAAFTFGREDLLPGVFQRIVDHLNDASGGKLSSFQYYLQRHIALDGDEHGPAAGRIVAGICGQDATRWQAAEAAAVAALNARLALWDAIHTAIRGRSV